MAYYRMNVDKSDLNEIFEIMFRYLHHFGEDEQESLTAIYQKYLDRDMLNDRKREVYEKMKRYPQGSPENARYYREYQLLKVGILDENL